MTGGECAGKTTLARALAARFATAWAPEAARAVADGKRGALGPEDVPVIAREHLVLAEEAERTARAAGARLVVFDQDLLSTVVYARHYYGSCPAWIERRAAERRGDLYLLCRPDLPWRADGVRDRPAAREEIHALFVAALRAANVRAVEIGGVGPAREALALAAVADRTGA